MLIGDNTAKWITLFGKIEATCAFCGRTTAQTEEYLDEFFQAKRANDFEAVERLKEKIIDDSIIFGEGKKNENTNR